MNYLISGNDRSTSVIKSTDEKKTVVGLIGTFK